MQHVREKHDVRIRTNLMVYLGYRVWALTLLNCDCKIRPANSSIDHHLESLVLDDYGPCLPMIARLTSWTTIFVLSPHRGPAYNKLGEEATLVER